MNQFSRRCCLLSFEGSKISTVPSTARLFTTTNFGNGLARRGCLQGMNQCSKNGIQSHYYKLSIRTGLNFLSKEKPKASQTHVFQPRWRRQMLFFVTCCIWPFILAFGHRKIPFLDSMSEKILQHIYVQDERFKGVDFEQLPEMKTKYDKELELMDRLLTFHEQSHGDGELDGDDDDNAEMGQYDAQMNVKLTDEQRAQLNRELFARAGQPIPNAT